MSGSRIRVLIVDDAVVVRKAVTDALGEDPDIEVVGTAANGRIALQKIAQVNPDILTLDVEMPEMNGLETLRALRKTHPRLPVLMFSTQTERGASTTIEALMLGASDYVTKPASVGSVGEALIRLRAQLVPRIKSLCLEQKVASGRGAAQSPPIPPAEGSASAEQSEAATPSAIDVVAIGVSTGGPTALAEILPRLPADFPVPIVIVQHMPPLFTRFLAERLSLQSALPVHEARGDDALEPGHVYIAPGDYHMVVRRRGARVVTALTQAPPEHSCRPSVDALFRSVSEVYAASALAVVLTGMGQDGLRGCQDIKRRGGSVFVQDEPTSVVWGMPGFVARAGLADGVIPLPDVARALVRRVLRHQATAPAHTEAWQ